MTTLTTRAVERLVQTGADQRCAGCGARLKWKARVKHREVIANVYVGNRWDRVEHWHPDCYVDAGEPHGAAVA